MNPTAIAIATVTRLPPGFIERSCMSLLFTPRAVGPLTLKNRIVVAPMCQYSAVDGVPRPWHAQHLARMALSGAGLVIVEATGVEAAGLDGQQVVLPRHADVDHESHHAPAFAGVKRRSSSSAVTASDSSRM